jgi:catechol 2,3-dioxygenase
MTTTQNSSQDLLPADLTMGTVMLKVGDIKLMTDYYQRALGLEIVAEQDGGLYLGRRRKPLVHLAPAPGLRVPSRGEAGLFHTALLFEDQSSLAATVATTAQYDPQSFTGSADHLVSEAFYFSDPEGNGIELYWDRPREDWSWSGKNVVMDSLALPPQHFLQRHLTEESLTGQRESGAGVGHVHLQVGDVRTAQDFYVDTLGFEKTAGWHGQALFVSAGGYHHHMAMNVWNSRGAGPRKNTLGLGEVLIEVPSGDDIGALADRLKVAGIASHHTGAELRFEDPWRNRIRVAVR